MGAQGHKVLWLLVLIPQSAKGVVLEFGVPLSMSEQEGFGHFGTLFPKSFTRGRKHQFRCAARSP